jgi:hypothetical protein
MTQDIAPPAAVDEVKIATEAKEEPAVPTFEIPKECKAGVVHNEGPNFELKVEMVPVSEPGIHHGHCL